MRLQIGASAQSNVRDAAAEAARTALTRAAAPAFAFVFATSDYDGSEVAAAVSRELGTLPWAGAATPAILSGREVLRHGIAIGVIDSREVEVRVGVSGPVSGGAREAGRDAALGALAGLPLPPSSRSRAMILLVDMSGGDAAEALHGAVGAAGAGIAWSGGGTSGPGSTLFARGQALTDHVVAITLDSHARIGAGVQHGWHPTGAPAMVTRMSGTVVERLEHRPAFEIYREAVEDREQSVDAESFSLFATTHPLGIPQADGEYLIRDPISVDSAGAHRRRPGRCARARDGRHAGHARRGRACGRR